MNGSESFIENFKTSMNYGKTQKIVKGITAHDVNNYLTSICSRYADQKRIVTFTWKKVFKVNTKTKRVFNGYSIYKMLYGRAGRYVIFGKAKWNNDLHRKLMKKISLLKNERNKFVCYGGNARGTKLPDHAVGILIGDDKKNFLHDNSMKNIFMELTAHNIANKMSDITCCYSFDITEV